MTISTFEAAINPGVVDMLDMFARQLMESRPRDQIIDREGDEYIHRWYLARKGHVPGNSPAGHFADQVALIPSELENLYLHRYLRGDDEEPHCHPWPNATLVLSGWYDEDIYESGVHVGRFRRQPGDIVLRGAEQVHAIVGVMPGTISLFATLQKERDWFFWTADGPIHWTQFRQWKRERVAAHG